MTVDDALELMQESILAFGSYLPNEDFVNDVGVGISVNKEPLMIIGLDKDAHAHEVTDRLITNPHFNSFIKSKFGEDSVLAKMVRSNNYLEAKEYDCIARSTQGVVNKQNTIGMMEALFVKDVKTLIFTCCINNSIMLCFEPNAKPLSTQVSIDFNDLQRL